MKNNKVDIIYDYFNDKLSETDKARVEQELKVSSEYNKTLDNIKVLHDILPYSNKEVEPPNDMKQRILSSIVNEDNDSSKDIESANTHDKNTTHNLANTHQNDTHDAYSTQQDNQDNATTQQNPKRNTKKGMRKQIPLIIMAAILLLSLIGNGVQYFNHKASPKQDTSMINKHKAQSMTLKPMAKNKTNGQAYISNKNGNSKLMVEANDIKSTQGNEVYQVWVIKGDKPHPAGTLATNNNKGMVVADLNHMNIDKKDTIALTLEPSPNNTQPKGKMIMASSKV
ncbi:anti-sigma factor [Staphylococcus durrellii]|uniref:anti-sigma factor n=1 Tax=Staphylococcus durrellii TaxID=2781773 RepID=UPI00189D68E0|nr:anti-sigma factor [Staphylococcus durrellii]MBF7016035.1 anti-sigma factor [Staphylococcus durrellii]